MKYELRRIGLLSSAMVSACTYGVVGLLYALGFAGVMITGLAFADSSSSSQLEDTNVAMVIGLSSVVILAVSILGGAIAGFFGALIYNLSAMVTGGLKLEFTPVDQPHPPADNPIASSPADTPEPAKLF